MANDNPSQELGNLLDGMNKHHQEQQAASDHLRNELLVAGGIVVAGAALYATHGMIGEGIANAANEERFLGRTGLRVADGLGSNTASLKLADFFSQRGEWDSAEKFLMKASNRGSGEAQFQMSQFVFGREMKLGTAKTPELMDKFWKYTEYAAHNGHAGAQLNYAYRLGSELGNDEQAFRYLSHAASSNYPRAMAELGKFYEAGNTAIGLAPNADKAEELYRAAAAQGDRVGETQLARFLSHTPLSDADWDFSFGHEMPAAQGLETEAAATALRTPEDVSNPDLLAGIRDTADNKVAGASGKPVGPLGKELVPPGNRVVAGVATATPSAVVAIDDVLESRT